MAREVRRLPALVTRTGGMAITASATTDRERAETATAKGTGLGDSPSPKGSYKPAWI
jgi:hypothetical protein